MTPDASQPCWLGSQEVAAIVGKLERAISTIDNACEALSACNHSQFALRLTKNTRCLHEALAVIAHAQRGGFATSRPVTQEWIDENLNKDKRP